MWVREPDKQWSFWWRGALPTLALGAVLAYNMTAFAQKTETEVRLSISEQLATRDLDWVRVQVDGQHVRLSGVPPTTADGERAVTTAADAKCQSWLGALPCARSVKADFGGSEPAAPPKTAPERDVNSTRNANAAAPDPVVGQPQAVASAVAPAPDSPAPTPAGSARWFDLTVVRKGNTLELAGDVAGADARAGLEDAARTHFPSGTIDNRLNVIGGTVSPDWEQAARHAVEVATRCERGVISLSNAALNIDCETQTVAAKDAINALAKQQLPGLSPGTVNVLALDEVKSCEEGLVKLVTRSQVRFTTNSAKLLPTSRPLLREIAHQLERCPGVVVVEGHTDAQGVREENVTLSLNRARAVVSGLVGLGVPAGRVRAEGFGPDRPLATNETATGRAQNRRIEFRVARTGIRGE